MASKLLRILALVACLLIFALADQIEAEFKETTNLTARRRNLQAGAIRIIIDFSYSDYIYNSGGSADRAKYILAKKLILKTRDLYVGLLRVKGQTATVTIPNFELTRGVPISGRTITGDLFTVFWAFNNDKDNVFASAAPLAFLETNGRPTAGEFNININAINPTPANELLHLSTFIHEFYHILVFNSELFDQYVDANNKPIGSSSFVT